VIDGLPTLSPSLLIIDGVGNNPIVSEKEMNITCPSKIIVAKSDLNTFTTP
jgi:hypothetical protein